MGGSGGAAAGSAPPRAAHASVAATAPGAQRPTVSITNLPYCANADDVYAQEHCRLDVYRPADGPAEAALVWFHGGGLTSGSKEDGPTCRIAASRAADGLWVAVPNYRLSPRARFPAYLDDDAVAWVWHHGGKHGAPARPLFLAGHSAGGYLTLMTGLETGRLRQAGVPTDAIARPIPVSGQATTHHTIRAERGSSRFQIIVDDAAPARWVRRRTPPILLLYASRDMPARAEENVWFAALMAGAGNPHVEARCIDHRDHGSAGNNIAMDRDPARQALLEFVRAHAQARP